MVGGPTEPEHCRASGTYVDKVESGAMIGLVQALRQTFPIWRCSFLKGQQFN